jgi:hypothetical protein
VGGTQWVRRKVGYFTGESALAEGLPNSPRDLHSRFAFAGEPSGTTGVIAACVLPIR